MTFKALVPRAQNRADPVCIGRQKRCSHGRTTVMIEISFSPKLVQSLHWAVGERYEVSVGEGADLGYIRVRPNHTGYRLKMPGNTSARPRLTMSYWEDAGSFPSQPTDCRPDTINKTLTIRLPWVEKPVLRAVGA